MKLLLKLSGCAALATMLAGCGEISYKRGAGPSDLQAAQVECRNEKSRDDYVKCMDQRGWTVQKMEDLDPLSGVAVGQANDEALDSVAHIGYSPDNRAPGVTATEPGTQGPAPESQKPAPNLTDVYKISSWWKVGGSPALLKQEIDACTTELGEAHRPPGDQRQATRGLLLCMKKKGWHGLLEYQRK